jgi:predicted nucleotide-binding protein
MSMRGLGWDDHPDDMAGIKDELARYWNTELVIEKDQDEFARRLLLEEWDFVVTDLLDDNDTPYRPSEAVGARNASEAAKKVGVVFILTGTPSPVDLRVLKMPNNVILKSKDERASWLAGDIHRTLVQRGLYVEHNQVFLIYGRDVCADGATSSVHQYLDSLGLTVCKGDVASFSTTIPSDLIKLMHPCAAFIAICTPDDPWEAGKRVPRGNVLFEMGIAVGLQRGLERLIILQKWGSKAEEQAVLPSDFGGNVPIRFYTCENQFPILEERLKKLRVNISRAASAKRG